jgi:hypothetical protein
VKIECVTTFLKKSGVLYSGALVRKIKSFYPNRKLVMGISILNKHYRVWAIPVRYEGPNPDLAIIEQDFDAIEDAVDYFQDFMRETCKDVRDITLKCKFNLRIYPLQYTQ